MDTLKELLGLIEAVPLEAWVLVLGLVFGVGATHYIKRNWLPDSWRQPRIIEGISTLLTALPITRFWPSGAEAGLYVGVTAGLSAVLLYKPLMRWAIKKGWVDAQKVSAQKLVQTPAGVVVRDITVPSAADEKTLFIGSPTEAPKCIKPEPSNE
jgi:hypothetical protein